MSSVEKLRNVLRTFPGLMEHNKKNEGDASDSNLLYVFVDTAPLADLVKFSSAISVIARKFRPNFKCLRTQQYIDIVFLKQGNVASAMQDKIDAAVAGLDKSDLLTIAATEAPVVMSYLLKLGCVKGHEFTRNDEKGRELLVGIELGL